MTRVTPPESAGYSWTMSLRTVSYTHLDVYKRQELLAKPLRDGQEDEVIALGELLGTLSLLPCTETVGELAAVLALSLIHI